MISTLRNYWHAQPFIPFDIYLANGRQVRVPHPEFSWIAATGGPIFVRHARRVGALAGRQARAPRQRPAAHARPHAGPRREHTTVRPPRPPGLPTHARAGRRRPPPAPPHAPPTARGTAGPPRQRTCPGRARSARLPGASSPSRQRLPPTKRPPAPPGAGTRAPDFAVPGSALDGFVGLVSSKSRRGIDRQQQVCRANSAAVDGLG